MNKDVGRSAERELVKILRETGFKAVRIPTSNSSPNPLPDVFAVNGELLLAFEVKSTWENKVKVRSMQVEKLLDFLSMFPMRGEAVVAVKFKTLHQWRFVKVHSRCDLIVNVEDSRPLHELLVEQQNSITGIDASLLLTSKALTEHPSLQPSEGGLRLHQEA